MSKWMFGAMLPLLWLTGCGTFEARAPRAASPRVETKEGVVATESTYESAGGWVHFERSWRPETGARGVLVVVHGLKDHSARYADFAVGLAKRGIAVHAYDHRGHGRSDGVSQRVDAFDDYVGDLDDFVRRTKQSRPGLPAFVLGHSMGGAIATGFALDHRRDIAGLILSAPALSTNASAGEKSGARFLAALFPGAGAATLDLEKFSRSPAVVAAAKSDPLVDARDVPAGTIAGLLGMMERIEQGRATLDLPILAMHGEADEITIPAGTRDFVAGVSSKDKTLWLCSKLVHDLLHEPESAAIADGVARWLEAHVAPSTEGGSEVAAPQPCRAEKP